MIPRPMPTVLIKSEENQSRLKRLEKKHNYILRSSNYSKTRIKSHSNSNQTNDQKSNEDQPKDRYCVKYGIR